jgi:hypothetical protein
MPLDIFFLSIYKQNKGRINKRGTKKGTTTSDSPQVHMDPTMEHIMMNRMESDTMKHPPC